MRFRDFRLFGKAILKHVLQRDARCLGACAVQIKSRQIADRESKNAHSEERVLQNQHWNTRVPHLS